MMRGLRVQSHNFAVILSFFAHYISFLLNLSEFCTFKMTVIFSLFPIMCKKYKPSCLVVQRVGGLDSHKRTKRISYGF